MILLIWIMALFGLGSHPAEFMFRLKSHPLSSTYLFATVALFILLPDAEELWRCVKASSSHVHAARMVRPIRVDEQTSDTPDHWIQSSACSVPTAAPSISA